MLQKYGNFCASKYEEAVSEVRFVVFLGEILLCYKKLKSETSWQFNLSTGAQALLYEPSPDLKEMAIKSAKATGLNFCSVDIFELSNGCYKVLEINAGVTIEKFALQNERYFENQTQESLERGKKDARRWHWQTKDFSKEDSK